MAIFLGKDRLRRGVLVCSAVAFALLTLQLLVGFPLEHGQPGAKTDNDMGMIAEMVARGDAKIKYTFSLWLSWAVVLVPGVVVAVEDVLLQNKASRLVPPI